MEKQTHTPGSINGLNLVRAHIASVESAQERGISVGIVDLWLAEKGRAAIAKAEGR